VLIGINLLREGLDIPECGLVAILDADKEGFLRSQTSLIQTIGRAARNVDGRVILYADKETNSIKNALLETERRRVIQMAYNAKHNITPMTVKSSLKQILDSPYESDSKLIELNENIEHFKDYNEIQKGIVKLRKEMLECAKDLKFEQAGKIRDEIKKLEQMILED
jgi:excinuclease ABC subunit B